MAYPPLAPSRQSRRRRWLFVALILFIIVAVIALAVRRTTEQRAVTEYMAVAEDVSNMATMTAAGYVDLLANIQEVDRPQLVEALDMMVDEAEAAERLLLEADVPAAAAETHGFLLVAVGSWRDAVETTDRAVVIVLDGPDDESGVSDLQQSFDLLRVGDLAYTRFLEALRSMDKDLVTRDFGAVTYGGDGFDAAAVSRMLRGVVRLGEARDLSVTAVTDPEPVAFRADDGVPVVPFTQSFTVNAVVANVGNETEQVIRVTMQLTDAGGAGSGVIRRQVIDVLEPGGARTLEFENLELQPGGLYEVVITVDLDEDADVTNNQWSLVFVRDDDA